MLSQSNLEYINHSILKLSIERSAALQVSKNIEIRSNLSILFFKKKREAQFFFVNKSGNTDEELNFEIIQAAKYKVIGKENLTKEDLSAFACNQLLPLLWSIMVQTLSYNLYNFNIDNIRLPLRHSLDLDINQINYKIFD
jgi:hypothetical protein